MWLLKKLNEDTVKYLLSEKLSYSIGRKSCDIVLEEDSSISRKHCKIYVSKKNRCSSLDKSLTEVNVVDEQSKYGTYLKDRDEWVKLNANEKKILTDGSVIKFGLMENIWRLEYKPVVVCTSGIQAEQKKQIQQLLDIIDGALIDTWSKNCSLIIVNEIILTIKVVLGLINGIPIVSPNYLKELVDCIRNQTSFPDYEKFKPDIRESILDASLVSFNTNNTRKELFKGKKFIIPTRRQLETLKEVILEAGGKVELFSDNGNWKRFAEENIIMIQMPANKPIVSEELNNAYNQISSNLKNKYNLRIIPESEIAQAVAYSSIEKYCNPKSTCFELRRSCNTEVNQGDILVEGTCNLTENSIRNDVVIPCSASIDSQSSNLIRHQTQRPIVGVKRVYSPDEHDTECYKKRAGNEISSKALVKSTSEAGVLVEESLKSSSVLKNNMRSKESQKSQSKIQENSKSKGSLITNYFEKQSKLDKEDSLEGDLNCEFWNSDKIIVNPNKRKIHVVKDNKEDENSASKKVRLLLESPANQAKIKEKESDLTKKTVIEESAGISLTKHCSPSPRVPALKKTYDIVEDRLDFSDFIGKDEKFGCQMNSVDELNDTLYSLSVISPAYLQDDGSLIDPPSVALNVKKFKKQKVCRSADSFPVNQIEEDISDNTWLEPHPLKYGALAHEESHW